MAMKRLALIACTVLVIGWMTIVGVRFLAENPGCLGPIGNVSARWFDLEPERLTVHNPTRVINHLRTSLKLSTFEGLSLEPVGALAAAFWFLIVFSGTGLWILKAIRISNQPPLALFAMATALGMGAWGLAVLGVGCVGLLYPLVLIGALVVATLASLPRLYEWVIALRSAPPRLPRGGIEWTATILALLALGLGLLYTLTPAIQSDGLRYHLAAPQEYLRDHRIAYMPYNAFTNFPFLIEMLFTLGLAVGGDLAAKLIHFACYALTGIFLMLLSAKVTQTPEVSDSEKRFHPGIVAAMVFWTTPTVLITGAWEFIDLGTALYLTALVFCIVRWSEADDPDRQRAWGLLAGLFLGFLIGTKYTMLAIAAFVPVVLLVELPSLAPTRGWNVGYWFRSSLLVGFTALVVSAPWFVKNAVLTGNPVYPMAWSVFGGGEWSEDHARFYLDKSAEKGHLPRLDSNIGETVRHLVTTPWEATIHWQKYEAQFLGPVFLLFLPLILAGLAAIRRRKREEAPLRIVIWFFGAYCVLWYFTYQSNRLLIPALGLLAILIAHALAAMGKSARRSALGAVGVLLILTLYSIEWSAEWAFRQTTTKPSAFLYLAGLKTDSRLVSLPLEIVASDPEVFPDSADLFGDLTVRDSYILRAFPQDGIYGTLPQIVDDDESVLLVGEFRAFHCPVRWVGSDWFDTPVILDLIRKTPDNDALLDRLLEQDIRWVFHHRFEMEMLMAIRKRILGKPLFSDEELKRYNELLPDPGSSRPGGTATHPRLRPVLSARSNSGSIMSLYRIEPREDEKRE